MKQPYRNQESAQLIRQWPLKYLNIAKRYSKSAPVGLLALFCAFGSWSAPAQAGIVTYTYHGPTLTCAPGYCDGLPGYTQNFSGAHFSIEDSDPLFGGGNIVFDVFWSGLGQAGRIAQSLTLKDSGDTFVEDIDCFADNDACKAYQPPSFFTDTGSLPLMYPQYWSDQVGITSLEFTDGELVNWSVQELVQGCNDSGTIISSSPTNCYGEPSYDVYTDGGWAVLTTDAVGYWTTSTAPVPLPAPFLLLLSAVAAPIVLRRRA